VLAPLREEGVAATPASGKGPCLSRSRPPAVSWVLAPARAIMWTRRTVARTCGLRLVLTLLSPR